MAPSLSRLVIDPLDRATRGPRRRYAEDVFWTGHGRWRDRIASSAYFTLSASLWRQRAQDAIHYAPFAEALERCRAPQRAVDLGTGGGASAALLAARFPEAEVTGVDGSQAMIRVAREAFQAPNLSFVCADFRRLPFPDDHFDLVAALNALPEPGELQRVSRAGCQVLIANTYFAPLEGPWVERLGGAGLRPNASGHVGDGGWLLLDRVQ